jgi:hypothetical protein
MPPGVRMQAEEGQRPAETAARSGQQAVPRLPPEGQLLTSPAQVRVLGPVLVLVESGPGLAPVLPQLRPARAVAVAALRSAQWSPGARQPKATVTLLPQSRGGSTGRSRPPHQRGALS